MNQQKVTIFRKAFITNEDIHDKYEHILFSDNIKVNYASLYKDPHIL